MWDRFIAALIARRWLVLALGAVLVAGSAALAPGLQFSSDATEHLPKVSPAVTAWLDLSRRFDAFNSLIVGLEEPVGPLTAEGLAALKHVTDRLTALKAGGVLSVSSVTNVDSIREGADGSLETELLIPRIPQDAPGLEALRRRVAADLQVSGALISRDQRGYLVLVRADPRKDPAELAALVQRTVDQERGPLLPSYFGAAFFSAVITRGVYAKLTWLVPAFALVLFGVLAIRVRRPGTIALVLGSAVLCLVVWLALVRALGIVVSFTSLTALLGVLTVAAVAFSRGLDAGSNNPLPQPVVMAVAASGLAAACLKLIPFAYVANFGVGMAVGAVAVVLVGLLVFVPLASLQAAQPAPPPGPLPGASLKFTVGLALVAGLVGLARAQFAATPQTMFRDDDDIGRSLAFFDRRFGGPDFIQVDFVGDLRDPDVAARLLRLTDLLEGSAAFPDVRTVAQVLGFLNNGFGGVHRIPTSRESLQNLWFFLEGRPDVRNLVSDARDEAMAVLRVPSKPTQPVTELVAIVERAVEQSLEVGPAAAKLRLLALAKTFAVSLPPARLDEVLAAASAPLPDTDRAALDEKVRGRVREFLASPDSPYQPTDEEWARLDQALQADPAERAAKLQAVASAFGALGEPAQAGQLVETILARDRDQTLNLRAAQLVGRLGVQAPEGFVVRATGALVDLLDPPAHPGAQVKVSVTGLPVVAAQIEADLLGGLWKALATLLGAGGLLLLALTRTPGATARALLGATLAAALTMAVVGTQVDSGSASLFLVPPLAALVACGAPGSTRLRSGFLTGLGWAGLALLLVGLAPLTRIGLALAIGLGAVVLALSLTRSGSDV